LYEYLPEQSAQMDPERERERELELELEAALHLRAPSASLSCLESEPLSSGLNVSLGRCFLRLVRNFQPPTSNLQPQQSGAAGTHLVYGQPQSAASPRLRLALVCSQPASATSGE